MIISNTKCPGSRSKSMDLSFPLIEFLSFPFAHGTIRRPFYTVACLHPCDSQQGELCMSYSDAFKMGLAGLIDFTKPTAEIETELYAINDVCTRISRANLSIATVELLLAEKYFKTSWAHKDFDCIYAVGSYLLTLPSVLAKTDIANDICLICEQIESREACNILDGQLCLMELSQHVFIDVA